MQAMMSPMQIISFPLNAGMYFIMKYMFHDFVQCFVLATNLGFKFWPLAKCH